MQISQLSDTCFQPKQHESNQEDIQKTYPFCGCH